MYQCKNLKWSQIAVANFVYRKYSLNYALDSMERLGAKKIELYAAYPHFCLDDITIADMKRLAQKVKDHHLEVDCVTPENCAYPVNIAAADLAARKRSIDYYIKGIQTASELEAPHCQYLPGFALFDEPESDAWKRGVESMRYVAETARAYGCDVVIEASPKYWTMTDSTFKTVKFIKEVDSTALRGLIDTVCIRMMKEEIDYAVETMGIENVGHVHFTDGVDPDQSGILANVLLGEGEIDMDHQLEVFDKAGYTGTFGLELFSPYDYEPEKYMRAQLQWCRSRMIED